MPAKITTTNQVLIEICLELGLELEVAKIYDFLIKKPSSNVTDISKEFNLSRQKIYKNLNIRSQFNLISKNDIKYSKEFIVKSSSFLLGLVRSKNSKLANLENNLKENLIWLNTPFDKKTPKIIDLTTGRNLFISYFIELYSNSKQEILFFGSVMDIAKVIDVETLNLVISLRLKNKTKHKVITFDKDFYTFDNSKVLRETILIQKPKNFISSYNVFDESVVIWNSNVPSCIIISDINIVNMMRFQFNLLWSETGQEVNDCGISKHSTRLK